MIDRVSAWGTSAVASVIAPKAVPRPKMVAGPIGGLWHKFYRPYLLGFSGLALAVALWGFGYKLSLYRRHLAPAQRSIVAKLWIEPPNASVVAVQRLKNRSNFVATPQVLGRSIQHLLLDDAAALALPSRITVFQSFDSPIALRSPPRGLRIT